jgi:tetratricopeptide (TPR) repeat protein
MELAQSGEMARLRRDKSREAIARALQGRWDRAVELNQEILWAFPEDVDTLNRLGKSLIELGRYREARDAFESAAKVAPYNTISKKNLERLAHLQETGPPPSQGKMVTPLLFIEESGKSSVTRLQNPAPRQWLAKMAAGDGVKLEIRDHALVAENNQEEYLGQIEAKLGMRLIRLIKGGNRYDATIISIHRQDISVIIWETYRHPDLNNVCSFPTRSKEDHKVYWRDAHLRYDIDSELETDEEFVPEWTETEAAPDRAAMSDGEESSESIYGAKQVLEGADGDDE